MNFPQGDLARAKTHEPSEEFPAILELVAYFGNKGRRGFRRAIQIDADMYFGRGRYGAPLTGEALLRMVDALRQRKR